MREFRSIHKNFHVPIWIGSSSSIWIASFPVWREALFSYHPWAGWNRDSIFLSQRIPLRWKTLVCVFLQRVKWVLKRLWNFWRNDGVSPFVRLLTGLLIWGSSRVRISLTTSIIWSGPIMLPKVIGLSSRVPWRLFCSSSFLYQKLKSDIQPKEMGFLGLPLANLSGFWKTSKQKLNKWTRGTYLSQSVWFPLTF